MARNCVGLDIGCLATTSGSNASAQAEAFRSCTDSGLDHSCVDSGSADDRGVDSGSGNK